MHRWHCKQSQLLNENHFHLIFCVCFFFFSFFFISAFENCHRSFACINCSVHIGARWPEMCKKRQVKIGARSRFYDSVKYHMSCVELSEFPPSFYTFSNFSLVLFLPLLSSPSNTDDTKTIFYATPHRAHDLHYMWILWSAVKVNTFQLVVLFCKQKTNPPLKPDERDYKSNIFQTQTNKKWQIITTQVFRHTTHFQPKIYNDMLGVDGLANQFRWMEEKFITFCHQYSHTLYF